MNAEEFRKNTIGEHTLPNGRACSFWIINTEAAIQLALWPLYYVNKTDKIPPSPEEEEIRYQNLLDKAKKLIIDRSYEPKFVLGEPANKKKLSIDIFKPDEDDRAILAYYTAILNQSGASVKREVQSQAELNGREALSMACAAFGLDPTLVKKWDNIRSAELLEDYDFLVSGMKKAQPKKGVQR